MYREIIAKTLIGKGKLDLQDKITLKIDKDISKTLGCWIINQVVVPKNSGKDISLDISYNIELWYATDGDKKTQVYSENVSFTKNVLMAYLPLETVSEDMYIKPLVIHYPSCTSLKLIDKEVEIIVNSSYIVNAFQEAILSVNVSDNNVSDLTLDEEIVMNVNPNYLTDKK